MSQKEALERHFKNAFINARKSVAEKGPVVARCHIVGNTMVYHATFKRTLAEHLRNKYLYEKGMLNQFFADVMAPMVIEKCNEDFELVYPGLRIENITVEKMEMNDVAGETVYLVVLNMDLEELIEQGKIVSLLQ